MVSSLVPQGEQGNLGRSAVAVGASWSSVNTELGACGNRRDPVGAIKIG